MEERLLWVLPGMAALTLAVWAVLERIPFTASLLIRSATGTLLAGGGLFLSGVGASSTDPLKREFQTAADDAPSFVRLQPRDFGPTGKSWSLVPDTDVLGPLYGKLVRRLCLSTGSLITVSDHSGLKPGNALIAGTGASDRRNAKTGTRILLAPTVITQHEAENFLSLGKHTYLALPDIDEDGRRAFWEQAAEGKPMVEIVQLEGVGTQVDWSWEQVIELVGKIDSAGISENDH